MDKKFDENKVLYKIEHSTYSVKYYVYADNERYSAWFTEKDIKTKKFEENNTTCCFSQLPSMLSKFSIKYKKWPNRLLFLCNFKKHGRSKYRNTYEEICWWLTICKKHKLLPKYINNEFAKTGNFILRIDTLDLNTLYIYLATARYLQEEPYFVKAVKYLVDDKRIDFHTAFTVASRCCTCNTGHHIIPLGKRYPFNDQHNNINFVDNYNLKHVNRLKRFLNKKESKDKMLLKDMKIGESINPFNLHRQLEKINVKETIVKQEELISNTS